MVVEIDEGALKREIAAARRELALTEREIQRALPRALTASARRARSLIAGSRGFLYERGLDAARIKKRVSTRSAKRGAMPTARVWLGANDVPAEYIRGNLTGRRKPPARGLSTRREGRVPRSFSIRVERGGKSKALYLRRVSPKKYVRITSSILEDMEAARAAAADEMPAILRSELGKAAFAIRRTAARRAARQ